MTRKSTHRSPEERLCRVIREGLDRGLDREGIFELVIERELEHGLAEEISGEDRAKAARAASK